MLITAALQNKMAISSPIFTGHQQSPIYKTSAVPHAEDISSASSTGHQQSSSRGHQQSSSTGHQPPLSTDRTSAVPYPQDISSPLTTGHQQSPNHRTSAVPILGRLWPTLSSWWPWFSWAIPIRRHDVGHWCHGRQPSSRNLPQVDTDVGVHVVALGKQLAAIGAADVADALVHILVVAAQVVGATEPLSTN